MLRTHTLPTPAYGVNIRIPFEIDRSTPVVFIFSWSTPDSAEYEPRMATAGITVLPSMKAQRTPAPQTPMLFVALL